MYFTETHEWVREEEGVAVVGISQFAQEELGDIVYVEPPEVGKEVSLGEEVAVLESTKAAADLYAPISGKIVAINADLEDAPELINQSPEEKGWLFKIEMADKGELQNLKDRESYLAELKPSSGNS